MIRKTEPADYEQIKVLVQSVDGFWDESWRDNAVELGVGSARGLSYVYIEKNRVVGFVCAHDCGFRAYVSELVVDPSMQGKGVATELLRKVEDELKERKCETLIADVWKDAAGFYKEQGWREPDVILLRKKIR